MTYWLDLWERILYTCSWSFHMVDRFQPFLMVHSFCLAFSLGHCLQVRAYWGPMNCKGGNLWILQPGRSSIFHKTLVPCDYINMTLFFPDSENGNVSCSTYGSRWNMLLITLRFNIWRQLMSPCPDWRNVLALVEIIWFSNTFPWLSLCLYAQNGHLMYTL